MIINNLIDSKTFSDLMKMYERQNIRVTNKVLNAKYVSFVAEGVQHLFTEDASLFPIELVESFGEIEEVSVGAHKDLWKFNKTTGYWNLEKSIERQEDAEKWLDIFQKDEPNEIFKLSNRKPKEDPNKTKITESVELIAKDFIKCHGKKPSGVGSWIFGIGSKKPEDWFEVKGKFSTAQKKAITKAEKDGKSKVFVMEDLSSEFQDVKYSVVEDLVTFRVALNVNGVETNVTESITEYAANNIGKRWVLKTLQERSLSKSEYKERETVVKGMKSKILDFKKRYGDKAKSVMYGAATKIAKESVLYEYEEDLDVKQKFFDKLKSMGFSEEDAPYPPINTNWKEFPIVKAIRKVEKETGIKYDSLFDTLREDLDPNIGRKWFDSVGNEVEIESVRNGRYFTTLNGKIGGAPIIPVDQLEKTIEVDTNWYQHKLKTDKDISDQEAADKLAKDNKDKEYSSISGKSKLDTGRRIKALDKKLRLSDGRIMTVKQIIDMDIKNGAVIKTHNFWNNKLSKSVPEEVLETPDGYYRDLKNIGKIGLEYAKQVLSGGGDSIEEEFKETSENQLRFPYKSVKFKDDSGVDVYRIVDNLDQALAGTYSKQEADDIVKTFNAMSKIETLALKESVKTFEIKYSIKDEDETVEGTKKYQAPDQNVARTRFTEDNKDVQGITIISITEV